MGPCSLLPSSSLWGPTAQESSQPQGGPFHVRDPRAAAHQRGHRVGCSFTPFSWSIWALYSSPTVHLTSHVVLVRQGKEETIQPHQPAHCWGWGPICAAGGWLPSSYSLQGPVGLGITLVRIISCCSQMLLQGRERRKGPWSSNENEGNGRGAYVFVSFSEQPQGLGAGGGQASPNCLSTELLSAQPVY